MHAPFALDHLLKTIGYAGLFAIIFAESGLFFAFFLPGDSILFTAGVLASQGFFSLALVIVFAAVAAILGNSVGYWFGKATGSYLYKRKDSQFFKKRHLSKGKEFYDRHGTKALILARFIPVVRTFAPIIAGAAEMPYRKFLTWNVIGAILWTVLVTLLGYYLGHRYEDVDRYLLLIVLAISLISIVPLVIKEMLDPEKL